MKWYFIGLALFAKVMRDWNGRAKAKTRNVIEPSREAITEITIRNAGM